MPTLSQVKLPVPKIWDEFEDIVVSAINSLQPIEPPQRYGRQGQAQEGVDIVFEDYLSRRTGVQCKNVETLSLAEMKEEIAIAETHFPPLESYVFAVTFPRDAKIHKQISIISADRSPKGKFRVGIWFWDDIAFFLSRELTELARHYPQIFATSAGPIAQSGIQTEIAAERLKALQEMWALRYRILPPRRYPDMDWDEALEDIALDLDKHAKSLRDINQRLGSTLPREVTDLLERAEAAAFAGSFEVSLADEIDVPSDARQAAGQMFDLLNEGIEAARVSLTTLGVKLL